MGHLNKNFKKLDSFSKNLLSNYVEKGFIVDKAKKVVYKIGDLEDIINNKDFQSIDDFSLKIQEIINQGITESKESTPYMYQNIEIKQSRYNIVVLSLAFDTYFLVSFVKKIRINNSFLNHNSSRENNLNLTLNEITNFLKNSLLSAVSIDMNKNILSYTKDISKIFDFDNDIVGKSISSLTPKIFNFPRILTNISQVIESGSTKIIHTRTKENTIYSVHISPYMNDTENEQIGAVISFQDITLLKANEAELIRKKEEVEEILDSLNMGMINCEVITDESQIPIDLKIIYVNNRISSFLKLEKQALIGRTIKEVFPTIGSGIVEVYGNIAITMKPHRQVYYLDFANGYRDIHGFSVNKGQVIITFIDVTDTVQAQKEFEDKIIRHGMILESAKTGFFEMNLKDEELYFDSFCTSLYKHEVTFKNGRNEFKRRLHYLDVDKVIEQNNKVLNGEIEKANNVFRFLNVETNEYTWIRQILISAEKSNGKVVRLLGLYSDIDEQKKLDEKSAEIENLLKETNKVAHIARLIYYTDKEEFEESVELSEFLGIKNLKKLDEFRSILHPDDLETFDNATEYIMEHPEGKVTKYRIYKNNEIRYIQSTIYGKRDDFGDVIQVFGLLKDNTEVEKARIEAEYHQKSFELIFNSSPAGIFLLNEKHEITMANNTYITLLEINTALDLTLRQLLGVDYQFILEILKKEDKVVNYKIQYSIFGDIKFFNLNIARIDNDHTNSYQGTMIDITREVEITDQMNYMATHDVLTGLYNRNYFEKYIDENKTGYPMGIMICDIDGLKVINDAFGHLNGDELLVRFSSILKDIFNNQMVARIGGDEFCIVLQNTSIKDLENYEDDIKERLSKLELYGMGFDVSVGYAIIDDDNTTFLEAFVISENIMYRRKLTERSSRKSKTLDTIMETLNEKTEETSEHCNRVAELSEALLKEIGYARQIDIEEIRLLSKIHDIGKITVSEELLSKPGSLSKAEFDKVKQHSESGYKIVKSILDSENIALGVLYHHERIDGKGYPHNLIGDQIPIFARVICITDAYDAMVNERSYKRKMTQEEAINELVKNSGIQFDSEYVKKFIKIIKKA